MMNVNDNTGEAAGEGIKNAPEADAAADKIYLLDVGQQEYGDAVLAVIGGRTILIDGAHPGDEMGSRGHPSIPEQLGDALGGNAPYNVDLLIVSHAHRDHIGCLPKLIEDGTLTASYALVVDPAFGWGRDARRTPRDARDYPGEPLALELEAALREEIPARLTDSAAIDSLITDAASLEENYTAMLKTLQDNGTVLVRHGRDPAAELLKEFEAIGLQILGPSKKQLLRCAYLMAQRADAVTDGLRTRIDGDALPRDRVDAYREIVMSGLDFLDAGSRVGALVNLQSIVVSVEHKQRKFLFTGDMQFTKPGSSHPDIREEMDKLWAEIEKNAPYDFLKIAHHGSDNAFSEEFLTATGAKVLGICAGSDSTAHPHSKSLNVMKEAHAGGVQWLRTDRNGESVLTFLKTKVKLEPTRGKQDDHRPNSLDVTAYSSALAPSTAPQSPIPPRTPPQPRPASPEHVAKDRDIRVTVRVPNSRTRVTLTIDVEPSGGGGGDAFVGGATDEPPVEPGGGRQLPRLLFVTNANTLARNIGVAEARRVIRGLRSNRRHVVIDDFPSTELPESDAVARLQGVIQANPQVVGVVIVGGYDVVPSSRVDALPVDLRERLPGRDDPDNFVVWNDDYIAADSEGVPTLPVSRIPDGRSADLVIRSLTAPGAPGRHPICGIRNLHRPFADRVFRTIGGNQMFISHPVVFNQTSPEPPDLHAEHVYLMLHGDFVDSSRFWGEETEGGLEALNTESIPDACGAVVFTGCCWGALTVDTPAARVRKGRPFGQKTPSGSIALSFLLSGARAFVGCTGAHYSPLSEPFGYYGEPMHTAFWEGLRAGEPPARALFLAKQRYRRGIPHHLQDAKSRAIEHKILAQYTCLGLGW